jgi:hypothetical protein
MTKDEAEELFSPYLETICNCIEPAWNDYFTKYSAEVRVVHTPRTRANIIHDHMVYRAWREFDGKPGVRVVRARGYVLLLIQNRALIRFKKLGKDGKARNYPTRSALTFAGNLLPMEGLPEEAARYNAGYVLNKLQTGIKDILISFQIGREVEYVLNIWFEPKAGMLTFPEITTPPIETEVRPKVDTVERQKNAAAGESSDGDSR